MKHHETHRLRPRLKAPDHVGLLGHDLAVSDTKHAFGKPAETQKATTPIRIVVNRVERKHPVWV